jgi:hypothetical protein
VEIVLDFRPFGDRKADPGEQRLDASQRAADRMVTAGPLTAPRQGHIDSLARQPGIQRRRFQCGLAGGECGFQPCLASLIA